MTKNAKFCIPPGSSWICLLSAFQKIDEFDDAAVIFWYSRNRGKTGRSCKSLFVCPREFFFFFTKGKTHNDEEEEKKDSIGWVELEHAEQSSNLAMQVVIYTDIPKSSDIRMTKYGRDDQIQACNIQAHHPSLLRRLVTRPLKETRLLLL